MKNEKLTNHEPRTNNYELTTTKSEFRTPDGWLDD